MWSDIHTAGVLQSSVIGVIMTQGSHDVICIISQHDSSRASPFSIVRAELNQPDTRQRTRGT